METVKYFTCARHNIEVAAITRQQSETLGLPLGCPECNESAANGTNPTTMTGDERAAELMEWLTEPLTADYTLVWKRIDLLVGRSTWNHEVCDATRLANEARTWNHPTDLNAHALHTLEQLAGEKPVIVVQAP